MDKNMQDKIMKVCRDMYKEDWHSPVLPGCARAVAEVFIKTGIWPTHMSDVALTYSETFNDRTIHANAILSEKPEPGGIIFFDKTYDAVGPDGIGPEDTYTHVGIISSVENGKVASFFHYRTSSRWTVNTVDEIKNWGWVIRQDFYTPKVIVHTAPKEDYSVIKIFIHPDKDTMKVNMFKDGKKVKGYFEASIKIQN